MPRTRSFKETVKERIEEDPAFRDALLAEGIDALLSGEVDVGKIILRDYINANGLNRYRDSAHFEVSNLLIGQS